MAAQPAQQTGGPGKGKKKNKEVLKVSLDEFNQVDAPIGHSIVNVKITGIDWAATMARHEQSSETQQVIVPKAPRAHRGPDIDFDSLPNDPPFKVTVYNLPLSVEEKDIEEKIFAGLGVTSIETTKTSSTVEFPSKDKLYEALCKDGTSFRNKVLNICRFGQQPATSGYGSGGYGNRNSGGNYGDRYGDRFNDRYNDRNQGNSYGQARGDRYSDRPSYNRDSYGNNSGSYGRSSSGAYGSSQQRGGYGDRDRYNDRSGHRDDRRDYGPRDEGPSIEEEEPKNWRDRPNPPPYVQTYNANRHARQDVPHHSYHQSSHHQQHQQRYPNQPSSNSYHPSSPSNAYHNNQNDTRPSAAAPPVSQGRPKLQLTKRKAPIRVDEPVSRNPAIFGEAKPSNKPYEKMAEVEEQLKNVNLKDPKE